MLRADKTNLFTNLRIWNNFNEFFCYLMKLFTICWVISRFLWWCPWDKTVCIFVQDPHNAQFNLKHHWTMQYVLFCLKIYPSGNIHWTVDRSWIFQFESIFECHYLWISVIKYGCIPDSCHFFSVLITKVVKLFQIKWQPQKNVNVSHQPSVNNWYGFKELFEMVKFKIIL